MGNKIGRPLHEEVGKPRVLPNAVPLPMPEKAPVKKEERVKVLPDGTEAYARLLADRARNGTVPALARFMQIPESEVREMMDGIVSRLREMYRKTLELGKAQDAKNQAPHSESS